MNQEKIDFDTIIHNLEVECFRLSPQGVAYPHYGYHKIQVNILP